MESGFFLRDTKDGHREYDCPDLNVDQTLIKQVNAILAPVQMLLNIADNEFINNCLLSIDTIVNAVFDIIASIDGY